MGYAGKPLPACAEPADAGWGPPAPGRPELAPPAARVPLLGLPAVFAFTPPAAGAPPLGLPAVFAPPAAHPPAAGAAMVGSLVLGLPNAQPPPSAAAGADRVLPG